MSVVATDAEERQRALEDLTMAEQKVLELLEIAGQGMEHLSTMDVDAEKFNELSTQYKLKLDEIQDTVRSHVGLLQEYRPFSRSAYGARKDLDLEREASECRGALDKATR